MKTFLFLPCLVFFSFLFFKTVPSSFTIKSNIADSTLINHILDGSVKEWPLNRFKTDEQTAIQYAMDNDKNDFFLAMNIPNFREQLKMMRSGMTMYIDLKGKKKESHGIEFPVKNENNDLEGQEFSGLKTKRQNEDQSTNEGQRKPDIKALRQMMALNLAEMKVFGFSQKAPDDQQLLLAGSANIAFSWDSADVMHIEYLIPLTMLGDVNSLDQKDISIGWKIHAIDMSKRTEGSQNSSMENHSAGHGGGFGGGGRRYGGGSTNVYSQADRQKMIEEQNIWTKYVINIDTEKKAF